MWFDVVFLAYQYGLTLCPLLPPVQEELWDLWGALDCADRAASQRRRGGGGGGGCEGRQQLPPGTPLDPPVGGRVECGRLCVCGGRPKGTESLKVVWIGWLRCHGFTTHSLYTILSPVLFNFLKISLISPNSTPPPPSLLPCRSTLRYPPGSKVVKGANRRYLAVPLGNLVDERYTVYFTVQKPKERLHTTSRKSPAS